MNSLQPFIIPGRGVEGEGILPQAVRVPKEAGGLVSVCF